jgi:hypothetical protein
MPLNLPSAYPGNPLGYVTYYKAQADNYSMSPVYARNPKEVTTVLDWEMSSMLANCSRSIATKVYVADAGAWSTASNWYPVGVPAAGDNVLIGEGVSVTYDIDAPTTSISYVRLDGTLAHPHNASTAINVNTVFITPTGAHRIGSSTSPLSASRTCRIIFSSSTDMDASGDTALQTKGIVSAGTRAYFGASKTFRLKVASNAGPAAGATQIILEAQPGGWVVGDRITICGTKCLGWWYNGNGGNPYWGREEETRTITGVGLSGTISLNSALSYGHTAPSSTLVATNTMRAYVANLSRNIKFLTENGTTCLRHRRAHDMQMHYPTYQAQWVEWLDMGRTEKGGYRLGVQKSPPFTETSLAAVPQGYLVSNGTISFATEARIRYEINSPTSQNIIVSGFDRSGTAVSQTVGVNGYVEGEIPGWWTRITGVRTSLQAASMNMHSDHRSRLITSSGIRNTNGNTMNSSAWTYDTPYKEANVQGRYPVHFHKCGLDVDVFTSPIRMLGCVVSGSPGWGIVHHLSHCNFVQCIAHDFEGSGIVAEAGNETGLWKDCHATKGRGVWSLSFKGVDDVPHLDPGRQSGYWFTGRMVKVVGCLATDVECGFHYNSRFGAQYLSADQFDHPRSLYGNTFASIEEASILHFKDNESIACPVGFFVTKSNNFQQHDLRTLLGPHLSWSCAKGFFVEYTAHYTMLDWTSVKGVISSPIFDTYQIGMQLGPNTTDQVFVRPKIDGFPNGIDLNRITATDPTGISETANGRIIIAAQLVNNTTNYPNANNVSGVDQYLVESSLTATASLSLSLTTDGSRRWLNYLPLFGKFADPLQSAADQGYRLSGEKFDSLYSAVPAELRRYPGGQGAGRILDHPWMLAGNGANSWDFDYVKRYGLFLDPTLGYTLHLPGYYSDRVTGELNLKMIPATMRSANYVAAQGWAVYSRGAADYTKTEQPAIQTHRVSVTMNSTVNVNLLQNATHSLSISMYVAALDRPFNCHVVDNLNGTITIIPPPTYTGTETFSYWVADNNANTTKGMVIVEVNQLTGTGRAGVNDFIATQNNTAVSVNVLSNDIGDSKALQTVNVVGGNAVGTASISTGGVIVFTPTSTYATIATQTAEVQYTFTASGGSAGASLYVTVNPPPIIVQAVNDFAATSYNTPISVNVVANDIGANIVLRAAAVGGGAATGQVSVTAGTTIAFYPTSTFATAATATASILYSITASGGSALASLLIIVNPPATGRSGLADFTSTTYNTAVSFNVLANDIGDNKVLQTAVVVGGAAVGTASISTGGVIVFTPTNTYAVSLTVTAEIQYTFTASGGSAGASLFVTVVPITTGVQGLSDFNSTTYNVAVSTNVLANDIGDSKSLQTAVVVGGAAVGTASISTGGIIVFTPTSTFARTITQVAEIQYTYTASGGSSGASLFVTVNAGPPLPVAVADFTSTTYNLAVSTNVLANDTGGTVKTLLTATVVGGNSVGTASISTGGVIVFTPSSTFATTLTQVAEIQYTFTTTGGSAAGSLFVTVNAGPSLPEPPPTPTAPVATDGNAQAYVGRSNGIFIARQAYDTNQGGFIRINNAFRIDGDATGSVDFDPDGILYVNPDNAGVMRVSYRVINASNLTASGVMTFQCVAAPRVGGSDGGSGPMIGAPVSWSRKSVSNIKSVAKAISAVFADLDPNDPIRLAERMVRKYTFAEVKKLIGTSDFESLLDMELQELVEEMERMKNGG